MKRWKRAVLYWKVRAFDWVTITRLREFYGSFKSVCDNLSIDLTEFEQIFGANESSFIIWDTDENGLIDALELFSGLTLMSSSKFEEKINCKSKLNSFVQFVRFQWSRPLILGRTRVHDRLLHAQRLQDLQGEIRFGQGWYQQFHLQQLFRWYWYKQQATVHMVLQVQWNTKLLQDYQERAFTANYFHQKPQNQYQVKGTGTILVTKLMTTHQILEDKVKSKKKQLFSTF